MDKQEFEQELKERIQAVFEHNPELNDHRADHPWLTNSLGDPFSGIWFVAENPSLKMVERIAEKRGEAITEEAQWAASKGDRLFRDMLVKHGFKRGAWDALGGWQCYITNVIKEADYVNRWRGRSAPAQNESAVLWLPVLRWQLSVSQPRLVVAMGGKVEHALTYLINHHGLDLPRLERIHHYSYIAYRPQGKQRPMHPARVQAYDEDMGRIATIFAE